MGDVGLDQPTATATSATSSPMAWLIAVACATERPIHPPFLRPKEVTLASTDLDARIRQNSADRASPVGISVSPPRWLLKRRKRRIVPRRRVRIAGPGRKPAPQNVSTKPGNRRSVDCGTGTSGRNPLPPGNVRARWGAMSVAYRPDTLATFH